MAVKTNIDTMQVFDQGAGNPVRVEVGYTLVSDDPTTDAALGSRARSLVCEAPRAAAAAFLAQCQVIDSNGWPEGAIALPLPRKP